MRSPPSSHPDNSGSLSAGYEAITRTFAAGTDALASSTTSKTGESSAHAIVSAGIPRSEEHTSELQSRRDLVCRLLLEKKNELIESGKIRPALWRTHGVHG